MSETNTNYSQPVYFSTSFNLLFNWS